MPEKKAKKKSAAVHKRRKLPGQSSGLTAQELGAGSVPNTVEELQRAIQRDGGQVLVSYRDPYGGEWLTLAALPIEKVALVTGHKDWRTLRRYTKLRPEELHKLQTAHQPSLEEFMQALSCSNRSTASS